MKVPTDIKELQRFMGMVNYLGKFLPNLSNSTQALRELLQKETAWHWDERHDHAFQDIKVKVTDPHILKYYDVNKPVTVSVDASSYGLGACLLQEGHPTSYASRSLNDAEKNYAQIEKELLAVVYGCTKYHQYIYGKQVEVETDHKPLEYLFKKTLTMAPPRLQRMMLQLQKYDLLVGYKPERTVQTAKQILKKAKYDGSDPNLALLNIRNTPIEGVGLSPAQLLMGRRTRTLLPTSGSLLHPSSYNYQQVMQNLQERQVKQKEYYDRGSKPLNPLRPGDKIHLRDESQNIWIPGTVTAKTEQPRSYIVDVNGSQYRRNRRDILDARDPTNTDPPPTVAPQEPQEPEDLAPSKETEHCEDQNYATRSGRIVKRPQRLHL
ncbi:hypothetical protein QZH41_007698 [Actinostola sp. cb2023]|nr:hypothetical protein QZH41_007698 [Actinostola sp. cb2023]